MSEITKNQLKFIASLKQRKFRDAHRLFVVEGPKMVEELLNSDWKVETLCATEKWSGLKTVPSSVHEFFIVSEKDLERMSDFKQPQQVLAVVKQTETDAFPETWPSGLILALDDVRDPGNLGTILRAAEWFGASALLLSESSVEQWNPKVVHASMGSIFRTPIHRVKLNEAIPKYKTATNSEVFGAVLEGENVMTNGLPKNSMLVMGSESHGISAEVEGLLTKKISIPSFGNAESLNVAMATSVLLYEYQRSNAQ